MKTRNGLVSNSSSSSFIIIHKDKNLSHEKLISKSMKVFIDNYGEDNERNKDNKKQAESLANDNEYILLIDSVEYGAEGCVERIIEKLCTSLNIKNVRIEIQDC